MVHPSSLRPVSLHSVTFYKAQTPLGLFPHL